MKIALASDHGGFLLKEKIKEYLLENGYRCEDFGTASEESVDYPDFALSAAEAVATGDCDLGIICCGTGIGVGIVANKVPGIRAANCHDTFSARMSRKHNNANILTLGQRVIGFGLACDIVQEFLQAKYSGGRHDRRLAKITEIEEKYCGRKESGR